MKFPNKKYINVINFKNDYFKTLSSTFDSINGLNLKKIINLLEKNYKKRGIKILVCGNGGSAAISNHFACDHQKIIYETGKIKPFIIS